MSCCGLKTAIPNAQERQRSNFSNEPASGPCDYTDERLEGFRDALITVIEEKEELQQKFDKYQFAHGNLWHWIKSQLVFDSITQLDKKKVIFT